MAAAGLGLIGAQRPRRSLRVHVGPAHARDFGAALAGQQQDAEEVTKRVADLDENPPKLAHLVAGQSAVPAHLFARPLDRGAGVHFHQAAPDCQCEHGAQSRQHPVCRHGSAGRALVPAAPPALGRRRLSRRRLIGSDGVKQGDHVAAGDGLQVAVSPAGQHVVLEIARVPSM